MRRALAVTAVALLLPGAAGAHVTIEPPFVEQGVEAEISFATPNERAPHATTSLRVTAPRGVAVVSAAAPSGWQATVSGRTVAWAGGRLAGEETAAFTVRILARGPAGPSVFEATQGYDDDESVEWTANLEVLPAAVAATHGSDASVVVGLGVAGVVVAATGVGVLVLLRRRSLQDQ